MASKGQPPPDPIPQSTVLALQAWKDKYKINNASWETVLNQAVTVNPSDSVFVKASFIDTRGTASGNIDLAVDTEISLEYYFYWTHNFNACNSSELIATPTTPDASNNLNQQVLVGPDIASLYAYNKIIDPSGGTAFPAYMCDPSGVFQATGINDADGLPYLVYQSTDSLPVPAILGPVIPASDIVAGTSYVVNTQGLTTNWAYTGVFDACANVLPFFYELDITPFTAAANPNGVTVPPANPFDTNPGMSPSAFLLPANVLPTLPYVSYMITVLGDTDWVAIDPSYATVNISASQMVVGTEYAIDNPGTLAWTAWGAANNNTGTEFIYSNPPPAPPDFPLTLTNAFFHTNSGAYSGSFGESPDDFFECVIDSVFDSDLDTYIYSLVSFTGSGAWCYDVESKEWTLPPVTFGVSTLVCPGTTNLVISNLTSTQNTTPIPVADLSANVQYLVDTTGVLDGSAPPFTWNLVSNLPTTDTANMVSGLQYQVYQYNGTPITYAPHQGVLTDVFTSQGPIPAGATPTSLFYNSATDDPTPQTPNIFAVVTVNIDGVPYVWGDTTYSVVQIVVTADASGNCFVVASSSLLSINYESPIFTGAQTVITTINGSAQNGYPSLDVSFVSNAADGDISADLTSLTNFRQTSTLVVFPTTTIPSLLVQLSGQEPSTTTYTYDLTTPNVATICNYYAPNDGPTTLYPGTNINPFSVTITTSPDGSGNFYYAPYPTSIARGAGWDEEALSGVLLNINGSAQPGDPSFTLQFVLGSGDLIDIFTMNLVSSTPAKFPTVLTPLSFTCSAPYSGTGSTSTALPLSGTLTAASVSGFSYLQGSVFNSAPKVGSIINSRNADPAPPSTGRAALYPTPYSVNNIVYDGTVREILTPATTRMDIRPVKKKWSMTIPRGSYNPNYLAELISREMSRQKTKKVYNVKGGPFGTQSTLTVPTDNIYNNQSSPPLWAQTTGGGANTFYDSKNPAAYNIPPDPNYNLLPDNADDMPFLFTPAMNSSVLNTNTAGNPTGAQNNYIYAEIPHPNANGLNNLPPPTFYINLVPLCNDVYSVSPTIKSTTPYYSILPFYTQNSSVTDGASNAGNSGVFPIVFGANQTSLLYNNENNGLFSFNYLHSPMYAFLSSGTNDLTEVTGHMYTTQKVSTNMTSTNFFTTLVDKNSGILLNQMNPPSFWEQLGFDTGALTVDLDGEQIGYQMKLAEFQAKTTGGFCGSSNIFNPIFHTANSAAQPSCPDTELIYTTATPAGIQPSDIITAYTPNLTIGTSYKVYYPGQVAIAGPSFIQNDWTSVGGPIVDTGVNMSGSIFTATSTGFNPDSPPDGESKWTTDPTVVIADLPITTNTQLQTTFFQVENTNVLNAATIPTVRESTGHYLVEITGYNSNYIDNESKYEIKAIVSAYWVSAGSFVSVPFPDSYNFFGTGAPITLSGLKVRILDPFTMKEPVIGPNSSIYLQINKMLSEQAVAQIPN